MFWPERSRHLTCTNSRPSPTGRPLRPPAPWPAKTGGVVIVTLGPDGALLADSGDGAPVHLNGHRVAVRDTTGAGDTFTGVLAAGLAAGLPLAACARRAVAASALAVTGSGARAAMPSAAAVDAILGT